jgi:hypothetical protein
MSSTFCCSALSSWLWFFLMKSNPKFPITALPLTFSGEFVWLGPGRRPQQPPRLRWKKGTATRGEIACVGSFETALSLKDEWSMIYFGPTHVFLSVSFKDGGWIWMVRHWHHELWQQCRKSLTNRGLDKLFVTKKWLWK